MTVTKVWDGSTWVPIAGAPGATGAPGTNGAPGSIWRSGTGAPSGALGIVGDWYLNDANGDVYEKTGVSTYTLRDNLTGPQGATGSGGGGAAISAPGNLGAAQALTLGTDLIGTLNANLIITATCSTGARSVLTVVQDATGARTLTVTTSAGSALVFVHPLPGAVSQFLLTSLSATDCAIAALGS